MQLTPVRLLEAPLHNYGKPIRPPFASESRAAPGGSMTCLNGLVFVDFPTDDINAAGGF